VAGRERERGNVAGTDTWNQLHPQIELLEREKNKRKKKGSQALLRLLAG